MALSAANLEEALMALCKQAQVESFKEDYKDLEANRALSPNSSLLQVQPVLVDGIIRVGGWLTKAPGHFEEREINSRKRWRMAQALADMIWRRWHKEYLPTLTIRSKWNKEQRNLKEGDLTLLKTDDVPWSHWPLGRILKTFPGSDGIVCMAEVKTSNGTLMRPATKLCM